jgi:hypothetical protein
LTTKSYSLEGASAALACAECGARALAYWSSSPLLWYVDRLSALWVRFFFLALSVLLAAFLSLAKSHRAYWQEIFS